MFSDLDIRLFVSYVNRLISLLGECRLLAGHLPEAAKALYLHLAEKIQPVMHGIVQAKRKTEAEEREAYLKEQAEKDNTEANPGEAPANTDCDAAMPDVCFCGLRPGHPNCEAV